jgi:hypothetical protein
MSLPTGVVSMGYAGVGEADGFDPVLGTYVPTSDRVIDDDDVPGDEEDAAASTEPAPGSALGVGARTFGIVLGLGLLKMALRPRSKFVL